MATGTGSQVLDDLAAALGCSVSTVDDDEDSLVSAPATKTCPPSPGGVEQTGNDEWFPETERARKDAAVYLGLEDEAPEPPAPRSRLPLLLAVLVAFVAALVEHGSPGSLENKGRAYTMIESVYFSGLSFFSGGPA